MEMSKCPNVELLYRDVEFWMSKCRNIEMSKCRDVEMSRCRKRSRMLAQNANRPIAGS